MWSCYYKENVQTLVKSVFIEFAKILGNTADKFWKNSCEEKSQNNKIFETSTSFT